MKGPIQQLSRCLLKTACKREKIGKEKNIIKDERIGQQIFAEELQSVRGFIPEEEVKRKSKNPLGSNLFLSLFAWNVYTHFHECFLDVGLEKRRQFFDRHQTKDMLHTSVYIFFISLSKFPRMLEETSFSVPEISCHLQPNSSSGVERRFDLSPGSNPITRSLSSLS